MAKINIVRAHYNEETDEMDLLINSETPQPAISIWVDDYFYLRLHPETREIVGATLLNASEWFARKCPYSPEYPFYKKVFWIFCELRRILHQVFSPKSLVDAEVQEYMRRELESFVA